MYNIFLKLIFQQIGVNDSNICNTNYVHINCDNFNELYVPKRYIKINLNYTTMYFKKLWLSGEP